MIEILPYTLYQRKDLLRLFAELGVDWDGLASRIKPRRVSRAFLTGEAILDALRVAPALGEQSDQALKDEGNGTRRGRRAAVASKTKTPALDRLMAELHSSTSGDAS